MSSVTASALDTPAPSSSWKTWPHTVALVLLLVFLYVGPFQLFVGTPLNAWICALVLLLLISAVIGRGVVGRIAISVDAHARDRAKRLAASFGGAGVEYPAITILPFDRIVHALGKSGAWTSVDLAGDGLADGFVSSAYLMTARSTTPSRNRSSRSPTRFTDRR